MIGNTNAEGILVADVVLGKDFSSTELKGLLENPIFFCGNCRYKIQIELLLNTCHGYKNVSRVGQT